MPNSSIENGEEDREMHLTNYHSELIPGAFMLFHIFSIRGLEPSRTVPRNLPPYWMSPTPLFFREGPCSLLRPSFLLALSSAQALSGSKGIYDHKHRPNPRFASYQPPVNMKVACSSTSHLSNVA